MIPKPTGSAPPVLPSSNSCLVCGCEFSGFGTRCKLHRAPAEKRKDKWRAHIEAYRQQAMESNRFYLWYGQVLIGTSNKSDEKRLLEAQALIQREMATAEANLPHGVREAMTASRRELKRKKRWRKPILPNCDSRRRARELAADGNFTEVQFKALCEFYGNICLACGKPKKLTRDHVIPLVNGGHNDISNIQPLCGSCNSSKGTKSMDYRKGAPLQEMLGDIEDDTGGCEVV